MRRRRVGRHETVEVGLRGKVMSHRSVTLGTACKVCAKYSDSISKRMGRPAKRPLISWRSMAVSRWSISFEPHGEEAKPMHSKNQFRNLLFRTISCAATAAQALAILLVAAVLATGSAQAQSPTYSVLYTFTGSPDGAQPAASLLQDAQGNLYGTTSGGGDPACTNGCGTVFKLDTTGKETLLYTFTGSPDGATPRSGLVRDAQGNLYGTTSWGGEIGPACTNGCGTVFKVDPTGK